MAEKEYLPAERKYLPKGTQYEWPDSSMSFGIAGVELHGGIPGIKPAVDPAYKVFVTKIFEEQGLRNPLAGPDETSAA